MAKKKTRILWLSKRSESIYLTTHQPKWETGRNCWSGRKSSDWHFAEFGLRYNFCARTFNSMCSGLKLNGHQQAKVELTQLKNGIKLEKVK